MAVLSAPMHSERAARRPALGTWWPGRELLRPDFKVDRRRNTRWTVRGTATLLSLGADMGILIELDRLDGSPWWLSGDSVTPITVGTRVSIGFSDPSARPALARVTRCERRAGGRYRVAVLFEGVAPC